MGMTVRRNIGGTRYLNGIEMCVAEWNGRQENEVPASANERGE
jgi:hypothetical protein